MKDSILNDNWIDFLTYIKNHNEDVMLKKANKTGILAGFKREPTELNFWYWYVEHKMGHKQ
jgi:hypothetical protein